MLEDLVKIWKTTDLLVLLYWSSPEIQAIWSLQIIIKILKIKIQSILKALITSFLDNGTINNAIIWFYDYVWLFMIIYDSTII